MESQFFSIDDDLNSLITEIVEFLGLETSYQEAKLTNKKDVVEALESERLPMPEPYSIYKTLRLWSPYNQLPFFWIGGYMDQPYYASKVMEACMKAENIYQNKVNSELVQSAIPDPQSDSPPSIELG